MTNSPAPGIMQEEWMRGVAIRLTERTAIVSTLMKNLKLIFIGIVLIVVMSGCETTRTEKSAGYPVKYPAQVHHNG